MELPLQQLTLLLGGNNSGKSSILQAIQFAVSVAQTITVQSGTWSGDTLSSSITPVDLIYSPLRDVFALAAGRQLTQSKGIEITFVDDAHGEMAVTIKRGKNRNIGVSISGQQLGKIVQNIDAPFSIIVPGLAGIPAYEEYKTPSVVRRAAARGDSNSVFRNILYLLKQDSQKWSSFQSRLSQIFSSVDVSVSFNPDRDEHIAVNSKSNGAALPIDSTGTSVLQVIQIIAYYYLYGPRLLILDEPDSHLHPNNQKLLSDLLSIVAAEQQTQILIATHSKYIVDRLRDDAGVRWIREGALVTEEAQYGVVIDALIEIGAMGEKDIPKSTKVVVLTEDTDRTYIELVLQQNGFSIPECSIWAYHGCSNKNVATTLIGYIETKSPGTRILVHRDRDYEDDQTVEKYLRDIESEKVTGFVTDRNDIESYFCTSKHISAVSGLDQTEVMGIREGAKTARREKILEKMINTKVDIEIKQQRKPNSGKISTECSNLLSEDFDQYAHGKLFLRGIREEMNQRGHDSGLLDQTSPALNVEKLSKLAKLLNFDDA